MFKNSNFKFVTTYPLNDDEVKDLRENRNFSGRDGCFNGKRRNLVPLLNINFESDFAFENDSMGMNPMSGMDENSGPNRGFTSIRNFETDVMGITPIDKS